MSAPVSGLRVVSPPLHLLALTGLLMLGALHCGAEEASPGAPSQSVSAPIRLVDLELSFDNSRAEEEGTLVGRCVQTGLPIDEKGVPDCVMLVSRTLADTAGGPATACERCDWPGQRVPSAATLARARLPETGTDCLCEIVAQPPPPDGDLEKAAYGFCYLNAEGEGDRSRLASHCPEKATLAMRGGTLRAMPLTLTIACY